MSKTNTAYFNDQAYHSNNERARNRSTGAVEHNLREQIKFDEFSPDEQAITFIKNDDGEFEAYDTKNTITADQAEGLKELHKLDKEQEQILKPKFDQGEKPSSDSDNGDGPPIQKHHESTTNDKAIGAESDVDVNVDLSKMTKDERETYFAQQAELKAAAKAERAHARQMVADKNAAEQAEKKRKQQFEQDQEMWERLWQSSVGFAAAFQTHKSLKDIFKPRSEQVTPEQEERLQEIQQQREQIIEDKNLQGVLDRRNNPETREIDGQTVTVRQITEKQKGWLKARIMGNHAAKEFSREDDPETHEKIEQAKKTLPNVRRALNKSAKLYGDEPFGKLARIKKRYVEKEEIDEAIEKINANDDIKDKGARIKQVKKYGELNNLLFKSKHFNKKKAVMQQMVVKFPSVPVGVVSDKDYCEMGMEFYKQNYADYPIKAVHMHSDERYTDQKGDLVGDHSHCEVSAINSKTGSNDLYDRIRMDNIKYIEQNRDRWPDVEDDQIQKMKDGYAFQSVKNVGGKNEKIQARKNNKEVRFFNKVLGEAKQQRYYEHFNAELEKRGYDFTLEIDQTRSPDQKAEMRNDSKQRKADRNFNYSNAKKEEKQRENKQLHEQNLQLKAEQDELSEETQRKMAKYGMEIGEIEQQIESRQKELKNTTKAVVQRKAMQDKLDKGILQADSIVKDTITQKVEEEFSNRFDENDIIKVQQQESADRLAEMFENNDGGMRESLGDEQYFMMYQLTTGKRHEEDTGMFNEYENNSVSKRLEDVKVEAIDEATKKGGLTQEEIEIINKQKEEKQRREEEEKAENRRRRMQYNLQYTPNFANPNSNDTTEGKDDE